MLIPLTMVSDSNRLPLSFVFPAEHWMNANVIHFQLNIMITVCVSAKAICIVLK